MADVVLYKTLLLFHSSKYCVYYPLKLQEKPYLKPHLLFETRLFYPWQVANGKLLKCTQFRAFYIGSLKNHITLLIIINLLLKQWEYHYLNFSKAKIKKIHI